MYNFNRPQNISSTGSRRNRRRQTKKTRSPERRRARFEFLEDRRVLAVLTVNSVGDVAADTSALTLRDAITLVNNAGDPTSLGQSSMPAVWASQISGAFGSNDSIQFDPSLAGKSIVLAQGELLISSPLTITGLPAAGTMIDANGASRIFDVTAAAGSVTLDALTLGRGTTTGNGGAIYSESALTVNNCTISDSDAPNGAGGGIFALAGVTITNSAILDNDTGNNVGAAAGIQSVSGAVTLTNSTLAYNYGGGILAEHGPVTVTNSTVFGNYQFGIQAGTLASDGPVTIVSSIVAADWPRDESRGFMGDLSYGSATPASVTNSLIGDGSGAGLTEAPVGSPDAKGNFIGGPIHGVIDPKLQQGANYNGGRTTTLMLLPGSPAIDTGANPDNLTTDQRGGPFARTSGAQTDMGAFELQTSKIAPTINASVADGVYNLASFYPDVGRLVAGVNGPLQSYLEGVSPSITYYSGPTASGSPLPGPFGPVEAGTYTVVVSFPGSAEYASASASDTFTIAKATTTTTVTSTSSTAVFGQYVRYDVVVSVAPGERGTPSGGTVTLWDGNTPLYSGFDRAYDTGFVLNGLSVGTHNITATYSGDSDFTSSTSAVLTEVVQRDSATTTLTSSSLNQLIGQPVTFTASVAADDPGFGVPTGSMNFWDGAALLGTATVESTQDTYNSGQATFTTTDLSVGAHSITASYAGDTNFTASPVSIALNQVIHRAQTVTAVTSSAAQSRASSGEDVTFTADVSIVAPDTGVPTGSVQFQIDGQNLGSPAVLDATDHASTTTSSLPLGNHRVTAIYSGNSTVDTSTGLLPGTISTVAGSGGLYTLPSPAKAAVLYGAAGIAVDPAGDMFIPDFGSNSIRKVDAKTGVISAVGGAPVSQGYYDQYQYDLVGMVCDASGDLFYSDPGANAVEKLSPNGVVTTVAGTYGMYGGYSGDGGLATAAQLNGPSGLALDAAGDLFIVDELNSVVREVTPNGIITTVAGGGSAGYPSIGDGGAATAANLLYPTGIAVNAAGDLFIADTGDLAVRKVDHATGLISTVLSFDAYYSTPQGLAFDAAGDLFIADGGNNDILEVSTGGTVTTFAGTSGNAGYSGDGGPAADALLAGPTGLAMDAGGNLFVADSGDGVIREVSTTGTINTVAGGGRLGTAGNGGPAIDAPLNNAGPLAVDSAGNLFIADSGNSVVREVSPAGIITTVAGNGIYGYSGDGGSATSAQLSYPGGLTFDAAGDLFISDVYNQVVRKVTPSGVISTVAGDGSAGYSGDGGPAAAASLSYPGALAVDSAGDLFIADVNNQVVRKVSPSGIITTVADSGAYGYPTGLAVDAVGDLFIAEQSYYYYAGADVRELNTAGVITVVAGGRYNSAGNGNGDGGPATAAHLYDPKEMAFDATGDLLIADAGENVLRSVNPAGIITTVAGGGAWYDSNGNYIGNGDGGLATNAALGFPTGVATDSAGDLFITDGNVIRKVGPSLVVTKDATTTTVAPSTAAPVFGQPITFTISVAADAPGAGTPTGAVQLVVDGQNFGSPLTLTANDTASLTTTALSVGSHVVTAVYSGDEDFSASTGNTGVLLHGTIKTIAGNGTQGYSGDGGPALNAKLNFGSSTGLPMGYTAVDDAGDLFIADTYNNVVREVTPDGNISTVAGNGSAGYSGDLGLAANAQLNHPEGIAVDAAGDLFIVDSYNNAIREVTPNGVINTVAGGSGPGYSGDGGSALGAQFDYPEGIAVDAVGDLFIADWGNSVVREIDTQGNISTVAGNGTQGYSADGVSATAAQLISPTSVAVDRAGDLFFTDLGNYDVREVRGGILSTVAGNSTSGYSGDGGLATAAQLNYPDSIALDAAGNLFIADTLENVIREVSAGIIYTVAGNGASGYSGDGQAATAAQLNYPDGIAVDAAGDLFFADTGNNVVREVTPTLIVSQAGTATTLTSSNANVPYGTSVTFTATVAVVAPGAGAPTGTVTFWDGGTQLASVALNAAGQATFTTSNLTVATHTITAVYSGDTNFVTSTSAALSQSVMSAQQEIAAATTQVQALANSGLVNQGNGNALVSKLSNATASISGGNITAGVNQLNAFINQIHALVNARKLDAADAQTLIADATAAIAAAVNANFA